LTGAAILEILKKPDRKTRWSNQTVYTAIDKLKEDPSWRGEREEGSGAPRKTDKAQDKALERYVNKNNGKKKITVDVLRRNFAWARNVGNSLLEGHLHDAGLKWLRRRRKTIVTK
jgi:DNA-binding PadR family transcriptional regulator